MVWKVLYCTRETGKSCWGIKVKVQMKWSVCTQACKCVKSGCFPHKILVFWLESGRKRQLSGMGALRSRRHDDPKGGCGRGRLGKSVLAGLFPYVVRISYWDKPSFKLCPFLLCHPEDFSHPSLQVKSMYKISPHFHHPHQCLSQDDVISSRFFHSNVLCQTEMTKYVVFRLSSQKQT